MATAKVVYISQATTDDINDEVTAILDNLPTERDAVSAFLQEQINTAIQQMELSIAKLFAITGVLVVDEDKATVGRAIESVGEFILQHTYREAKHVYNTTINTIARLADEEDGKTSVSIGELIDTLIEETKSVSAEDIEALMKTLSDNCDCPNCAARRERQARAKADPSVH